MLRSQAGSVGRVGGRSVFNFTRGRPTRNPRGQCTCGKSFRFPVLRIRMRRTRRMAPRSGWRRWCEGRRSGAPGSRGLRSRPFSRTPPVRPPRWPVPSRRRAEPSPFTRPPALDKLRRAHRSPEVPGGRGRGRTPLRRTGNAEPEGEGSASRGGAPSTVRPGPPASCLARLARLRPSGRPTPGRPRRACGGGAPGAPGPSAPRPVGSAA